MLQKRSSICKRKYLFLEGAMDKGKEADLAVANPQLLAYHIISFGPVNVVNWFWFPFHNYPYFFSIRPRYSSIFAFFVLLKWKNHSSIWAQTSALTISSCHYKTEESFIQLKSKSHGGFQPFFIASVVLPFCCVANIHLCHQEGKPISCVLNAFFLVKHWNFFSILCSHTFFTWDHIHMAWILLQLISNLRRNLTTIYSARYWGGEEENFWYIPYRWDCSFKLWLLLLFLSLFYSNVAAKDAIFYSYNKYINGFAAILDEKVAQELASKQILSCFFFFVAVDIQSS